MYCMKDAKKASGNNLQKEPMMHYDIISRIVFVKAEYLRFDNSVMSDVCCCIACCPNTGGTALL